MIILFGNGEKNIYLCVSQDFNMDTQRIKNIKNRDFKIYSLVDPETEKIRYIGVTVADIKARLSQHIWEAKTKKGTHKRNWIKGLIEKKLKPKIKIIEVCNYLNWEDREKYWIEILPDLTNTHLGGAGVVISRSEESKQRSAKAKYKPVVAIDEGRNVFFFNSHKEASRILGVPRTSVEYSISRLDRSSYGFNFIHKEMYTESLRFSVRIKPRKCKYQIKHLNILHTPKSFAKLIGLKETIVHLYCDGKNFWNKSHRFDGNEIEIFKI